MITGEREHNYWPASCQEQNLGLIQTFCQQLVHHLLNDQRAHECVITWKFMKIEPHDMSHSDQCASFFFFFVSSATTVRSRTDLLCLTGLRLWCSASPKVAGTVRDQPEGRESNSDDTETFILGLRLFTFDEKQEQEFLHHVGIPPVGVFFWLRRQNSSSCESEKGRCNIYFKARTNTLIRSAAGKVKYVQGGEGVGVIN